MPLRPISQVRVVNFVHIFNLQSVHRFLSMNKMDSMGLLSF